MADINDYVDQMAEESQKKAAEVKDPRSFMSPAFQTGVEAFLRGAAFDASKSEDWKEGWSFSMKQTFYKNTFKYVFGGK